MQNGYKDLIVWKKGIELAEAIYKHTEGFPKKELFGITSQLRRAAVSNPSNIAEGWSRDSPKYFIQFLNIAKGSLAEVETQLILAGRLQFMKNEALLIIFKSIEHLARMLNALINSIQKSLKTPNSKDTHLNEP
ncbi:MAG: four helix bundle protein [Bacteroidetes bacterium]|nr:four helix bundle protein [Bacteroidota bacterium]